MYSIVKVKWKIWACSLCECSVPILERVNLKSNILIGREMDGVRFELGGKAEGEKFSPFIENKRYLLRSCR